MILFVLDFFMWQIAECIQALDRSRVNGYFQECFWCRKSINQSKHVYAKRIISFECNWTVKSSSNNFHLLSIFFSSHWSLSL